MSASIINSQLCLPLEDVVCLLGDGEQLSNVAFSPWVDDVRDLFASGLLEGCLELEDAGALASSQVEHFKSLDLILMSKGSNVSLCQVNNMDVVTDARAIWRVVIRSKNTEMWQMTGRNLLDVWQQVVWNVTGILADLSSWMSANWVEVPQGNHLDLWIGNCIILHHLLDHGLSLSVWINWLNSASFLVEWHIAVDGGAAGEDQGVDVVRSHQLEHVDGCCDVVVVVLEGFLDRLADSFHSCEMNDTLKLI